MEAQEHSVLCVCVCVCVGGGGGGGTMVRRRAIYTVIKGSQIISSRNATQNDDGFVVNPSIHRYKNRRSEL